jgi:hypothetical protein
MLLGFKTWLWKRGRRGELVVEIYGKEMMMLLAGGFQ